MSSESLDNHQHVFDGECLREVWRPEDGPGDGDVDLVADGHTRKGGHPTWKIYTSDMPDGVQRTGNKPPLRVYLDDKACYEVLTSGVFSGNKLGKCWPYDFTLTGRVRATRPNRGRPAYFENGNIATGYKVKGTYYFYGQTGDPTKVSTGDNANTISAPNENGYVHEGGTGDVEVIVGDDEGIPTAPATKRRKIDDILLSKPLDELDETELDELRHKYIKAMEEADEAHVRAAQMHLHSSRAERERATISDGYDKLREKLQQTMKRLETKHRDNVELDLALKRNTQDSLVTRRMLEKTKGELRELKNAHAVLQVRVEAADEETVRRLREEQDATVELCKTLYVGHLSSKAIVEGVDEQSGDDLRASISLVEETQLVVDDGIEAIKTDMESKGLGDVFQTLTSVDLVIGGDAESNGTVS